MSSPSYVLIQKKEWEQIKKNSSKCVVPKTKAHTKLVKQSKDRVQTLPNSVDCCPKHIEGQKKFQQNENKTHIKAFSEKSSKDNTAKELKKARQLIFDNSCNGKQLKGPLTTSKILEERLAQIKFNKELKQKLLKLEKEQPKSNTVPALNTDEALKLKQKKLAALETVKQNKAIETAKIERENKSKEDDVKCNKIDAELTRKVTDTKETQQKLKTKRMQKRSMEGFNAEVKQNEKIRNARNLLDDSLTEKENHRTKYKLDKANKKIVTDTQNNTSKSNVSKIIETRHNQEKKAYEDFDDKGTQISEDRQKSDEQQRKGHLNKNRQKRVIIEKPFKAASEIVKEKQKYSDRSSITLKSAKIKQKGPRKLKTEYEFKEPQVILRDQLKSSEKEKSPSNGTKASQGQFAEQPTNVLEKCKHKHFLRKVIHDYQRTNNFNTITLPIPNY